MEKNPICIYHEHCNDGTTAAAVFLRKFAKGLTFPLSHGYEAEDIAPILEHIDHNTVVYTIDCALGIKEFLQKGAKVITLDHHAGMKDEMDKFVKENKNLTYIFDNHYSGATLAWKYFFPNEQQPKITLLVEDSDLWQWRLKPESEYVNVYLPTLQNQPEKIIELFDDTNLTRFVEQAQKIHSFTLWYVEEMVKKAKPTFIAYKTFKIPAYNTTFLMKDFIANRLLDPELGVSITFSVKEGKVNMSVRGREGSKISALEVAQSLGGNGHRNSAGTKPISLDEFAKRIIEPIP